MSVQGKRVSWRLSFPAVLPTLLIALGLAVAAQRSFAVELAPGDIVLFSEQNCGVYRLDPVTLVPTQITDCLGLGSHEYHQ